MQRGRNLVFANTQINQRNIHELSELAAVLAEIGIKEWQVQITGPMGRAVADRPEWLLQPYDMLELFPMLAEIAERYKDILY